MLYIIILIFIIIIINVYINKKRKRKKKTRYILLVTREGNRLLWPRKRNDQLIRKREREGEVKKNLFIYLFIYLRA